MGETIKSVGLDIGTTSTQMILSELTVENRASSFAVPELDITNRKILYKSQVHFTPLLDADHMDPEGLRRLIEGEYRCAGITREDVDTGAVIITGESSRKENARAVLHALADFAGDFVVATAGPDLESLLCAKGSGAEEYSRETGKTVLHMDIGGGTSNLSLIRAGKVVRTGCLNVGGRLVKLAGDGRVLWVSPVLKGLFPVETGEELTQSRGMELANLLTRALEMAAGLRSVEVEFSHLLTKEAQQPWVPPEEECVISFSGGVAECIGKDFPWLQFGDIGVLLGKAIRESLLCRGAYRLGSDAIRATVIGAGCHSAQLSGSTVFCREEALPRKNLRAVTLSEEEQWKPEVIRRKLSQTEGEWVLALPGIPSASYDRVMSLGKSILEGVGEAPLRLCLEADMAKALGQVLALHTEKDRRILCIDRVRLREGSFLDVGTPIGPAFPVVVKTLVLER